MKKVQWRGLLLCYVSALLASCQDATYFCQTYKEDYCDYTSVTSPENSLSWELNCKVDGVENCSRHDSSEFDANAFGCAVAVNLTGGDSWNVEASGCITHTEPRESPRKVCSLQPVERPTDGLYYCSCRGDFCNKYVIVSFEPTVPSSTLTSQASQASREVETRVCQTYRADCEHTVIDSGVTTSERNLPCQLKMDRIENCSSTFPPSMGEVDYKIFGCSLSLLLVVNGADESWSVQATGCIYPIESYVWTYNECSLGKKSSSPVHYQCSCRGDLCNRNVVLLEPSNSNSNSITTPTVRSSVPQATSLATSQDTTISPKPKSSADQKRIIIIVISTCISVLVFAFFISFLKWYWSVCHRPPESSFDREDNEISLIRSPSIEMLTAPGSNQPTALHLSEKIGVGRFAEVWWGKFLAEDVAVKIFYEGERPSWIAEVNAYIKPVKLRHDSLLRFWFAEKHIGDSGPEFWLVTDYHANGSLCDFLKVNAIGLEEMCVMALSMAAGMTYLHSRVTNNDGVKPVIAHRDIKSRNVLIKTNKTCCISDFGLSIKFKHGDRATEAHGQVGTVRYMAPEVLEGAISFQEQSFLRTDIYAVALVLWEMASRCNMGKGIMPYQQPYEAEIGSHPTVEQMLEIVVVEKLRPSFGPEWDNREPLQTIRQTIEECWDSEADARLTAQCIEERLKHCRQQIPYFSQSQVVALPTTPTTKIEDSTSSTEMTPSWPPNGTIVHSNNLPKETAVLNWTGMNRHCHPNGTSSFLYHDSRLTNGVVPRMNGVIETRNMTKPNRQLFSPSRHMFNPPPPEASSSSCPPPYSAVPESMATEIRAPNSRDSVSIGSDGETSL